MITVVNLPAHYYHYYYYYNCYYCNNLLLLLLLLCVMLFLIAKTKMPETTLCYVSDFMVGGFLNQS